MNKVVPLRSTQNESFSSIMINLLLHEGLYYFDRELMSIGKLTHTVLENILSDSSDVECGVINSICALFNKIILCGHLNAATTPGKKESVSALGLYENLVPLRFFENMAKIGQMVTATRSSGGDQVAINSSLITWTLGNQLLAANKNPFMQLICQGELAHFLMLLITFTFSSSISVLLELSCHVEYWLKSDARGLLCEMGGGADTPASLHRFLASSPNGSGVTGVEGFLRFKLVDPTNGQASLGSNTNVLNLLKIIDMLLCKVGGVMPHRGCVGGEDELVEFWFPASLVVNSLGGNRQNSNNSGFSPANSNSTSASSVFDMGGEISVDQSSNTGSLLTSLNTGSGVTSTVPCVSAVEEFSYSYAGGDPQYRTDTLKVLLMEDSVLVQKILLRLLNQNGCDVTIAKNGRLGLEQLQTVPYDIAIIDFVMPIQDGVTTMRLFKEWMDQQRLNPDYQPGDMCNEEIILVGHSDAATDFDKSTARYNDMHIFCEKPMNPKILDIILNARRNYGEFSKVLETISTKSLKMYKDETSIMNMISAKFSLGGLGQKSVQQRSSIRIKRGTRSNSNPPPINSGSMALAGLLHSHNGNSNSNSNGNSGNNGAKPTSPHSATAGNKMWDKVSSILGKHPAHHDNNSSSSSSNHNNNSNNSSNNHHYSNGDDGSRSSPDGLSVRITHPNSSSGGGGPKAAIQNYLNAPVPMLSSDVTGVRVLVVDDSVAVQKIFHRALAQYGCSVKVGRNGRIGVDIFKQEYFDCVFVDFHMPVLSGPSAIRLMTQLNKPRMTRRALMDQMDSLSFDSTCSDEGSNGSPRGVTPLGSGGHADFEVIADPEAEAEAETTVDIEAAVAEAETEAVVEVQPAAASHSRATTAEQNTRACLIIGMSDNASIEDKDQCFRDGMHVFCSKPIDLRVLHTLIDTLREYQKLSDVLSAIRVKIENGTLSDKEIFLSLDALSMTACIKGKKGKTK